MKKSDWENLSDSFNDFMPENKSNAFQKITFTILCILGSTWMIPLIEWGATGFAIHIVSFFICYFAFKYSFKKEIRKTISISFNPTFKWAGKSYSTNNNEK